MGNNWWETTKNWWKDGAASSYSSLNASGQAAQKNLSYGLGNTVRSNLSKGASGGGWFSKANAGRTASIAGGISTALSVLSKLTDKTKKGQPGPVTGVGKDQLTAGLYDWTQFFS